MRYLDSLGLVDTEGIHPEMSIVFLVSQSPESSLQVGLTIGGLPINGEGVASEGISDSASWQNSEAAVQCHGL